MSLAVDLHIDLHHGATSHYCVRHVLQGPRGNITAFSNAEEFLQHQPLLVRRLYLLDHLVTTQSRD